VLHGSRARDGGPRLSHPALSSQPQGGVVYANGAGNVKIIDSTVAGCSAGTVRR